MRQWFQKIYSNKRQRPVTEKLLLRQCILTAILGVASMLALAVSTWAWFTMEIGLGTYQAESSTYGMRILHNGVPITETSVYLIPGKRTRFDIKAVGNDAEGFCYVELDGKNM